MSSKKISIPVKLYILTGVFSAGLIGYGIWSNHILSETKVSGPHYNDIIQMKDVLADILPPPEYIVEGYLAAHELAKAVHTQKASPAEIQDAINLLRSFGVRYEERHDFWAAKLSEGPIRDGLLRQTHNPAMEFFRICDEQLIPAALAGDGEKAESLMEGPLSVAFHQHKLAVDELQNIVSEAAADLEVSTNAAVATSTNWSIGVAGGVVLCCGLFGWYTAREMSSSLRRSAKSLRHVARMELAAVGQQMRANAQETTHQATLASGAAEQYGDKARCQQCRNRQCDQGDQFDC